MRVLLNGLQAGNRSGTGRYTMELARRLPGLSTGVDCAILWPRHLAYPARAEATHGAFVPVASAAPVRRLFLDQFGLRTVRKRLGADIVHYPANIGSLFGLPNVVVTVHDLSFLHEPTWFRPGRALYYRYAVGRSLRVAARIIADSRATAADLEDLLGIEKGRIDVIPLGVSEEFRPVSEERQHAVRKKYGVPGQFLLYAGTLEPRKNLARVIEAWNRIAGECDQDLVLAGRHGWKVAPILRAAAESPFADRIHFPGFVAQSDLPALLGAAHAFIWPSLCEGFGLPPIEAMACGVPVLTSNVSSLPEIAGDAAVLVDPWDVDAIAQGILAIATNPSLRATLRDKGLARAATYTWNRTAQLTLETYRTMLSIGHPPPNL